MAGIFAATLAALLSDLLAVFRVDLLPECAEDLPTDGTAFVSGLPLFTAVALLPFSTPTAAFTFGAIGSPRHSSVAAPGHKIVLAETRGSAQPAATQ